MSNLPPDLKHSNLPENQLHSHFNEHSGQIVSLLQEAGKMFNFPLTVELNNETMPFIRIGDTIDILPSVVERKSLTGVRKIPGYQLVTYEYFPGNRFEPPDVDEIELGGPMDSYITTVIEAIKHYVAIVLDQKIENLLIENSLREEND
jgi:hypothetical protein